MILKDLKMKEAVSIFSNSKIVTCQMVAFVAIYYLIAVLSTSLEGVSLVLLVDLITGRFSIDNSSSVMVYVKSIFSLLAISPTIGSIYLLVVVLHFVKAGLSFSTVVFEGYLCADARRKVQEAGFKRVLDGEWEFLRNMQIGTYIGSLTEEASNVAKYYLSIIKVVYALVSTLVYVFFAVIISWDASVAIALIGVPCLVFLQYLFKIQAEIVEKLVAARQKYYADITEQLTNLFQVKVDNNSAFHIKMGMSRQKELTRQEVLFGISQAGIISFNFLLPGIVLLVFQLWALLNGQPLSELIYILAGIGVIGTRVLAQVNVLVSNFGNIMAFSGSVIPVSKLLSIRRERNKETIREPIVGIRIEQVSYAYNREKGICGINLDIRIGRPLFVVGPSGSGKTTLANIIAGIYEPQAGRVIYIDSNHREYIGSDFRPKVGYVTQDIQLFQGTIRENLVSFNERVTDDMLWDCLRRAGAEHFVSRLGGLEAKVVEAGRSLSGGEKRRLGIARILISQPNVLILDEVTVGLDSQRKTELLNTINQLAQSMTVMSITHDEIDVATNDIFRFS